jgi:hypothetical protein
MHRRLVQLTTEKFEGKAITKSASISIFPPVAPFSVLAEIKL